MCIHDSVLNIEIPNLIKNKRDACALVFVQNLRSSLMNIIIMHGNLIGSQC